jgi:anti-sigma-K factor RskA
MSDLHPMSGAYAVDALDDLERVRFERHLLECPECAAEVQGLQEAAGLLALAVDPVLPDALRSRVMAEIGTVRPLPPQAPRQEVVRRTARRFPRLVAAAAAALVVATGATIAVRSVGDSSSQAPVVAVSQQVMQAPDARAQSLSFDDGSRATIYHSKSVDRAVLVTKNMADAPLGQVYELWFKNPKGVFVPAGLMDSGGNRTIVLQGDVGNAKSVGITVEPAKGSKHPTSAPIAMFDLSQSV